MENGLDRKEDNNEVIEVEFTDEQTGELMNRITSYEAGSATFVNLNYNSLEVLGNFLNNAGHWTENILTDGCSVQGPYNLKMIAQTSSCDVFDKGFVEV
jgi:hypothetical protein